MQIFIVFVSPFKLTAIPEQLSEHDNSFKIELISSYTDIVSTAEGLDRHNLRTVKVVQFTDSR